MSVVPPRLGQLVFGLTENPVGVATGSKRPASLITSTGLLETDTLYPDNGGNSGTGYFYMNFALQLQGPFNAGVCTDFHRLPLSETSFQRLLVLIKAIVY